MYHCYLWGYVFTSVCLSVCLSTRLRRTLWTEFEYIFWRGGAWPKDQTIRFWWLSETPFPIFSFFTPVMHSHWDSNSLLSFTRWQHYNANRHLGNGFFALQVLSVSLYSPSRGTKQCYNNNNDNDDIKKWKSYRCHQTLFLITERCWNCQVISDAVLHGRWSTSAGCWSVQEHLHLLRRAPDLVQEVWDHV